MENNKLPAIPNDDAKEFHKAIHDYEIVDGNPLTIGHALKDLPTKVISHGRIYDTEYVSAGMRIGASTTIDITQKSHETALPRAKESIFNNINSQLNISRCDGEVMSWAHADHYVSPEFDDDLPCVEDLQECFNKPYTLNALVPLKKGKEPTEPHTHFAHYQIKGKPAHYVCENLYPVDPDVVQDL